MLQSTSYSGATILHFQLQKWPLPELVNLTVTVTALGGIIFRHRRDEVQLQLLILTE